MNKDLRESSKTNRSVLRAKLKYGDIEKIMAVTEAGRSTVERWFKNENDRDDIELAVNGIIKANTEKLTEKLNQLKAS